MQKAIIPKGPEGCLALGNHYIQEYYLRMGVSEGAYITKEGVLAYPEDVKPTKFDKGKSISFQKDGQNLEVHLDKDSEGQLKSVSTKLDIGEVFTDFALKEDGQCRVEKIRMKNDSTQKNQRDIVIYDAKFCSHVLSKRSLGTVMDANGKRRRVANPIPQIVRALDQRSLTDYMRNEDIGVKFLLDSGFNMWFMQPLFEESRVGDKEEQPYASYHPNYKLPSPRNRSFDLRRLKSRLRGDCTAPLLVLAKPSNSKTPLTKPLDPSIPQVYAKDSFRDAHLLDGESKYHEAVDKSSDGTTK